MPREEESESSLQLRECALAGKALRRQAEIIANCDAEVGEGSTGSEIAARRDPRPSHQKWNIFTGVVSRDVGRIAAVIGSYEQKIFVSQSLQQHSQLRVEGLECAGVAGCVVAMAVLRIEVDQVREAELRVGFPDPIDPLAHA